MNIQEMKSWFNILTDSYMEPYFIDTEITEFINNGIMEFTNDIIFKEYFPTLGENERGLQALNSMESVIQGSEILQPLIIPSLTVPVSSGVATISALDTAVSTFTGDSNDKSLHVISVTKPLEGEDRLVRFVRHGDLARFKGNIFKAPTERNPIFTVSNPGLSIYPSTITSVDVTLLKTPRKVSVEDDISSDMPPFTHQRILAYAIANSGLASRDDVMLQLQKLSGNSTDRQ